MSRKKKKQVIAIANPKGGSGKTTTAINLGAYLAAFGNSVLLADIDPQANATRGLGFEPGKISKTTVNVLLGPDFFEDIIHHTTIFGYELAPASFGLEDVQVQLARVRKKEFQLRKALEAIKQDYDFVLIDCPPTLGLLTINGLTAAQSVIIPIQCEYFALQGARQLIKSLKELNKKIDSRIKVLGVVMTMYNRWSCLSRQVLKEVRQNFPIRVFDALIPRCVKLAEAQKQGKNILQYDSSSPGARAYRQLAREIVVKGG